MAQWLLRKQLKPSDNIWEVRGSSEFKERLKSQSTMSLTYVFWLTLNNTSPLTDSLYMFRLILLITALRYYGFFKANTLHCDCGSKHFEIIKRNMFLLLNMLKVMEKWVSSIKKLYFYCLSKIKKANLHH